ncbi:hypothetical protein BT96DRAFT_721065 [Gymnopus androsaceus JB14]|uniref:MYND-type domain-containing protein n=1 Tax=Gymnopus androsaceus JB14 TaxID=1447944 RepID=A0A6A4HP04_9AGAR|nr:hypothetical protein BT96DRAFT_721065 [Gymnopus androsaceus JB14]
MSVCFQFEQIKHRGVYFLSHLLSRISKKVNSRHDGATAIWNDHIADTWKLGMTCLIGGLVRGRFDSVIISVEAGILPTIRRFLRTFDRHLPRMQDLETLFRSVLEVTSTYTYYRSVQKVVAKAIRRYSYDRDLWQQRAGNSEAWAERWWISFIKIINTRIDLSNSLERLTGIYYCNTPECITPPSSKFLRCSGCTTAFYCSRQCQKTDRQKHRVFCQKRAILVMQKIET